MFAGAVLALTVAATPLPPPTPLPEIAHTYARPFCSALRTAITPAVAALLENDRAIVTGAQLMEALRRYSGDPAAGGHAGITLLQMENLVGPLTKNFDAIERLLRDPQIFRNPPLTGDDRRLLELRDGMQRVTDAQKASLNLINGIVQTQSLKDIQQVGNDAQAVFSQPDTVSAPTTPSSGPGLQDPNQAGLPPDPNVIDLAAIPGLSVGSNPISRIADVLVWTHAVALRREEPVSSAVLDDVSRCVPPNATNR
jgi:hypothetical protein